MSHFLKSMLAGLVLSVAAGTAFAGNDVAAEQVTLKNQGNGQATAVSNVTKEQGGNVDTTSTNEKRLLRAK